MGAALGDVIGFLKWVIVVGLIVAAITSLMVIASVVVAQIEIPTVSIVDYVDNGFVIGGGQGQTSGLDLAVTYLDDCLQWNGSDGDIELFGTVQSLGGNIVLVVVAGIFLAALRSAVKG